MHLSCSGLEPWREDRGMGLWELQVPLEEPLPTPTPCNCVANGTGAGPQHFAALSGLISIQ